MGTTVEHIDQLLTFATDRGVTPPARLTRPVDIARAVTEFRRATWDTGGIDKLLTSLARSEEVVTHERLADLRDEAARLVVDDDATRELCQRADRILIEEFRRALGEQPGDDLTAALRDAEFDDLAAQLQAHARNLPPGLTAEDAIEADGEVLESWRAAPALVARLDRYVTEYVTPLVRRFGIAGDGNRNGAVSHWTRVLAFLVDPDSPVDLYRVGGAHAELVMASAPGGWGTGGTSRLGPFFAISGAIRLNSPREAEAQLEAADAVRDPRL